MMEKKLIINNYVPPNYGRVKKALFNLGLKVYRRSNPLTRMLYNGMASLVGIPLWCVIPGYEFGGIRHEVQKMLKKDGEKPIAIDPHKIYDLDEIKNVFRLTPEENTDPRMLRLAIKNLDRYRGNPSKELHFLFGGVSIIGFLSFLSIQSLFEECDPQKAMLLSSVTLLLLRASLQIATKVWRASNTLLRFILNTDKEILIMSLPLLEVSLRTQNLIRKMFWKNFTTETNVQRRRSFDGLFDAINAMRVTEWKKEEDKLNLQ